MMFIMNFIKYQHDPIEPKRYEDEIKRQNKKEGYDGYENVGLRHHKLQES